MVVLSNIWQEIILFSFLLKKEIVENEIEKLFFMKGDFFRNIRECIITRCSLVNFLSMLDFLSLKFLIIYSLIIDSAT